MKDEIKRLGVFMKLQWPWPVFFCPGLLTKHWPAMTKNHMTPHPTAAVGGEHCRTAGKQAGWAYKHEQGIVS